jgi:hypothetical protein
MLVALLNFTYVLGQEHISQETLFEFAHLRQDKNLVNDTFPGYCLV